ncbi:MAG: type III pantothenate kinase [Cyanobacteriota bacterium]|nr:type III pantothenate kinase [Cyanobacteriota bacterium]
MSPGGGGPWLLVGNSRWHWAADQGGQRRYWSEAPGPGPSLQPQAWAAVGPVPAPLEPSRRVTLDQVPLQQVPPWLGIDRALAGYQAWCHAGAPVLVADAGTALSLTRVDAQGRFAGGRLMAGAALQLQALHQGTQALPAVRFEQVLQLAGAEGSWPQPTDAAMACGVLQGLAGALQRAASQLEAVEPRLQLWLTGGDGPVLHQLLQQASPGTWPQRWILDPGLCLDGLARAAVLS